MVADNRALEVALRRREYPNLQLKSAALDDEDHLTVAPRPHAGLGLPSVSSLTIRIENGNEAVAQFLSFASIPALNFQ